MDRLNHLGMFAGEIGASEHKANWNLGYKLDDFDFNWSMTYIGAADFDDQFLSGFGIPAGGVGIGSVTYHDVQASYLNKLLAVVTLA